MKELIEQQLLKKIVPFWSKLADREFGGFYGHVDTDLCVRRTALKGLVQQSRILWAFSALENHYRQGTYRSLADGAYRFLRDRLRDPIHGGFFWTVSHEGKPLETRKVTYGQGFAIYGLSEYAKLSKDPSVFALAKDTFTRLESAAFDPVLGGYREEFYADWTPDGCGILGDGVNGCVFSMNTALHLMESYVNLYQASPSPDVKAAIERLLEILKTKMYDPLTRSVRPYFDSQYRSLDAVRSFGHDIEAAWLCDLAAQTIGLQDSELNRMTFSLAESVYEEGFNGTYLDYSRKNGTLDTDEVWWVQSEAMVGFYRHFQKTGNPDFRLAVHRIFQSILDNLVDPREGGEWFWSVDAAKKPNRGRGMAELWKCPYHNVRSLLALLERMES